LGVSIRTRASNRTGAPLAGVATTVTVLASPCLRP
jgi:hypothetical protein